MLAKLAILGGLSKPQTPSVLTMAVHGGMFLYDAKEYLRFLIGCVTISSVSEEAVDCSFMA